MVFHDHGIGMSPETLQRACDPFYTTRPANTAMGLGLSVSQGIIQSHRGRLLFESENGSHTKVIVDIPAVTA